MTVLWSFHDSMSKKVLDLLRGIVYMTKRAKNRALGNTTRGSIKGREVVITFDTKGAR